MIIGLLIVGSVLGGVAAIAALIVGQSVGTAVLIYLATAVASVLVISIGCAFRPRKSPGDPVLNTPVITGK